MFLDLILSGDTKVNSPLANEGGYVGSGQEDKGNGVVFNQGNVQSVLALELNVDSAQEVECRLL